MYSKEEPNKEDIDRIMRNLDNLIELFNNLYDNKGTTVSIISKLLDRPEFSKIFDILSCHLEYVRRQINSGKYMYVNKFKDIILKKLSPDKCNEYAEFNVLDILKKLGLSEEDAKKIIAKELGKTISIENLLSRNIEQMLINSFTDEFINDVNLSCRTSYCLAMKLSSLWLKLNDYADILKWEPRNVFEKILFSQEVLQNAKRWPLSNLLIELGKPHFKDLRENKDIIEDWINQIAYVQPSITNDKNVNTRFTNKKFSAATYTNTYTNKETVCSFIYTLKIIGIGVAIGIALYIVSSLLLRMSVGVIPILICSEIICFLSGIIAGDKIKSILTGIMITIIYTLLVYLFIPSLLTINTFIYFVMLIFITALGGILVEKT